MKDGSFSTIQVTKQLDTKHLEADSIKTNSLTIRDVHLNVDINMTNRKVKEAYESNKDTNCYNDEAENTMKSLQNLMYFEENNTCMISPGSMYLSNANGTFVQVPDDVDYENIPDNHGVWCFNTEYGLIFKFKKNGKLLFTHGNTFEWSIPVELGVTEDRVNVSIGTF